MSVQQTLGFPASPLVLVPTTDACCLTPPCSKPHRSFSDSTSTLQAAPLVHTTSSYSRVVHASEPHSSPRKEERPEATQHLDYTVTDS